MATEQLTPERLAEIRERCDKATASPWTLASDGSIIQTSHITRDVWTIPHADADMPFIAHAREDVPDLLAEIDRLRNADHSSTPPTDSDKRSLCGCGRPVRYIIHGELGACNKYARCMTWSQQAERIIELSIVVRLLASIVDRIDNGHCTLCGRHRGWEFKGGEKAVPGKCENDECLSHKIARLVPR